MVVAVTLQSGSANKHRSLFIVQREEIPYRLNDYYRDQKFGNR